MTISRGIERGLISAGLILCAVFALDRVCSAILSQASVAGFEAAEQSPAAIREASGTLDFSLWSEKRIKAYQEALAQHFDPPLAVLYIQKINLEVPVFDGTSDATLDRGVGRIIGTARPGGDGNIGIAGHRDGFFRSLKDIAAGDSVTLRMKGSVIDYVVEKIVIVTPDDVSVLEDRPEPSLTLVTCYPFYFIGSAPQRYIVECSRINSGRRNGI